MSISSGYRVEVFDKQDTVSAEDVIELWTSEGVLDRAEAERRVSEVLVVASDRDGRPAGISTTYLKRNDQLRAELWHTRVFVAAAHRRSGLAIELARVARDHLSDRFVTGGDRRGIGVLFEIESEILKRFFPQAIWPRTQFVFIGENARGDHVRVFYFPGALSPEPDGTASVGPQGNA
jgi:GNAT superfamily N-acetyltransferase